MISFRDSLRPSKGSAAGRYVASAKPSDGPRSLPKKIASALSQLGLSRSKSLATDTTHRSISSKLTHVSTALFREVSAESDAPSSFTLASASNIENFHSKPPAAVQSEYLQEPKKPKPSLEVADDDDELALHRIAGAFGSSDDDLSEYSHIPYPSD